MSLSSQLVQDVPVRQQRSSSVLRCSPHRLAQLEVFKQQCGSFHSVIYVPCCGFETAPSKAFLEGSRIIYADTHPKVSRAFGEAGGYEFHEADAYTYTPEVPVDLALMFYLDAGLAIACEHLNQGGFLVCTNRHRMASRMRENTAFQHLCAICSGADGVIDRASDLREFFETIDEASQHPVFAERARQLLFTYGSQYGVIKDAPVLARYRSLRHAAANAMLTKGRDVLADANDPKSVLPPIPRKRNDREALHVFRKLRE